MYNKFRYGVIIFSFTIVGLFWRSNFLKIGKMKQNSWNELKKCFPRKQVSSINQSTMVQCRCSILRDIEIFADCLC